ncbi:MAG: WecB/TagA/CpsF family glycosyltransferase, partial [Patescibacteria group bacterium]
MIDGPKYHDILGVKVASSDKDRVLEILGQVLTKKSIDRPFFVVTANPEIVMLAQDDPGYKEILRSADLVFADGSGLRWAGVTDVVPGRRIVEELCKKHDYRLFFLGGLNGVTRLMAQKYGGKSDPGERNIRVQERNAEIIKRINEYNPDVLFVAYGAPWQERWIYENLSRLKCKVVMGVGGSFDYLTGKAKLPPVWLEKLGLEWLWRLVHEPSRWRRQLNLVRFAWKLLQT